MAESSHGTDRSVYTIGHSNHSLEDFIDLLKTHRVEMLVDIRSHPYAKYAKHFNKRTLTAAVKAAGIKYQFAGKELGGQPEWEEFYDEDGYVLYSRIAESQPFIDGISLIEEIMQKYRVAILCSEENPSECHRRLLVGRVLDEKGIKVLHIRKARCIDTEEDLREVEVKKRGGNQLSLFENSETIEWKSTQSVSRKGPRRNSSER